MRWARLISTGSNWATVGSALLLVALAVPACGASGPTTHVNQEFGFAIDLDPRFREVDTGRPAPGAGPGALERPDFAVVFADPAGPRIHGVAANVVDVKVIDLGMPVTAGDPRLANLPQLLAATLASRGDTGMRRCAGGPRRRRRQLRRGVHRPARTSRTHVHRRRRPLPVRTGRQGDARDPPRGMAAAHRRGGVVSGTAGPREAVRPPHVRRQRGPVHHLLRPSLHAYDDRQRMLGRRCAPRPRRPVVGRRRQREVPRRPDRVRRGAAGPHDRRAAASDRGRGPCGARPVRHGAHLPGATHPDRRPACLSASNRGAPTDRATCSAWCSRAAMATSSRAALSGRRGRPSSLCTRLPCARSGCAPDAPKRSRRGARRGVAGGVAVRDATRRPARSRAWRRR